MTLSLPDLFTTARLRAERLRPQDQAAVEQLHCDPVAMAELGGVRDRHETCEYIERNLQHWSEFGFGLWMLRERDGGETAGRAALRHLSVEGVDEVEVGFALHQRFWGRGLATEIGESCASLARHDLGLSSLVGVTTLANHASQRVLGKLGMDLEREVCIHQTRCLLYRVDFTRSTR